MGGGCRCAKNVGGGSLPEPANPRLPTWFPLLEAGTNRNKPCPRRTGGCSLSLSPLWSALPCHSRPFLSSPSLSSLLEPANQADLRPEKPHLCFRHRVHHQRDADRCQPGAAKRDEVGGPADGQTDFQAGRKRTINIYKYYSHEGVWGGRGLVIPPWQSSCTHPFSHFPFLLSPRGGVPRCRPPHGDAAVSLADSMVSAGRSGSVLLSSDPAQAPGSAWWKLFKLYEA